MVSKCTVAIIGAGPYGLAAAVHLRQAGVETRIFGHPMEFWKRHMPEGMLLRSSWDASHLADPSRTMTLDDYELVKDISLDRPVPLARFIDYGEWFQQQLMEDVDGR